MSLLESIGSPEDLKRLNPDQLAPLAEEIRAFLVAKVSQTGGHLGPNLGVVELTMALHRVFDSPFDPIVFDTGHQSYVHKILTGRQDDFATLRQPGGISGYPSRSESEHDWVENSHASTSLSWAQGMAKAFQLQGEPRTVVAVIGDGALTGGMAWEALNNIAAQPDLRLIVVVNDNGRSYLKTVGGLATRLSALRTDRRYEPTLRTIKTVVSSAPVVGGRLYSLLHAFKRGMKDWLAPQGMFSDLGLKYLGPIDGHDVAALEVTLEQARDFGGPVLVHCLTKKGRGYHAAEDDQEDHFHAVGKIDHVTGRPLSPSSARTWTQAFSELIVEQAESNPKLVAITAAMLHPVGLDGFRDRFPDRVFDVGIAEQHAVTSAAGLATAGLHPVVAVYATFLNRAFDQALMDVALHGAGVTFVLDRAGVTGPDGPSHHGMWDLSLLSLVPGLRLAAPRDEPRLAEALDVATHTDDGPTAIRYSKDPVPAPIPAVGTRGSVDVLLEAGSQVLLVGVGQLVGEALAAGQQLAADGVGVTVVDPVWSLPVSDDLVELARSFEVVVTVEDNLVTGGVGASITQALASAGVHIRVQNLGIPPGFLAQGARPDLLEACGLSGSAIADVARALLPS